MTEEYLVAGIRYTLQPFGNIGKRYGNQKCKLIADGMEPQLFDSKGEARRYVELLRLQTAGKITDLCRPVASPLSVLHPDTHERFTICTYKPDFQYKQDGNWIVEDFKSPTTANDREFKLKRKLYDGLNPDNPLKVTIKR